jgi:phosphate transport system protein
MPEELRGAYHRELDQLDLAIATLLGLVPDAVGSATTALLSGDSDLARSVARWRDLVDDLYGDVEATIEAIIARQAPVARDLRFLMCCVRILPEVRDAVELIGRIGDPQPMGFADRLNARVRTLTLEMGDLTADAWKATGEHWRLRDDPDSSRAVRGRARDALVETHSSLVAEISGGGLDVEAALQMALRAGAYDRLARHSAAIDRLVASLVAPRLG